ncbi:MAG: hypothetical protein ABL308_13305 [Oceanicaulis sp.]
MSYEISTDVPQVCTVSAVLEQGQVVDAGQTGLAASFNPVNQAELVVADILARCNTGVAVVTVATQNNFRLFNQGGGPNREIPFVLAVAGTSISGGVGAESSYLDSSQPSVSRRMTLDVGEVDPLSVEAGEYTDTIIISVAPTG